MYIYNNPKPTLAAERKVSQLEQIKMEAINVTELRDLKKGEFFKLKPDSKIVFIKDEYFREEKRFSCIYFDDISKGRNLKPDTVVYTQFEF